MRATATLCICGIVFSSLTVGCASWNVNYPQPPLSPGLKVSPDHGRPFSLVDVMTIGPPPSSNDDAYQILAQRCQAAERQKTRLLNTYSASRWSLFALSVLSSGTAVALTSIGDPQSARFSQKTLSDMRTSSIALGGLGVALATIAGGVGFETRIDTTRNDLVALRTSMDTARARWHQADEAERQKLLSDLAVKCNAEDQVERLIASQQSDTFNLQAAKDALKYAQESLKIAETSTATTTTREQRAMLDNLIVKFTDWLQVEKYPPTTLINRDAVAAWLKACQKQRALLATADDAVADGVISAVIGNIAVDIKEKIALLEVFIAKNGNASSSASKPPVSNDSSPAGRGPTGTR